MLANMAEESWKHRHTSNDDTDGMLREATALLVIYGPSIPLEDVRTPAIRR